MTTVLLVRHGRTTANAAGVLAGWTEGVHLDEAGRAAASGLAARLAGVRLAAAVCSPLARCQETLEPLLAGRDLVPALDERLGEVRYGDWTGLDLKRLAKDRLWPVVQAHPSGMTFPGDAGESMRAMSARAVDAVRDWTARVTAEHGESAVWLAVSHGDVIKAVVADALGLHLDGFQRIVIDPCSVTLIRYTPLRPFLMRLNDTGDDLARVLAPPKRRRTRRRDSDADVGGGRGADR